MKNTTWLANAFTWGDEVMDSAQSPAVKLGTSLLPILAPLVPAFVTALHLHKMYLTLVGTDFPTHGNDIALWGAVITALVLELLGWVGTIAFVKNLFKWVKNKEDEYLIPTALSFLGYVGYVADMVLANSPKTNNDNVFLLLALLSVPAGFLFAVLFITGDADRREDKIRQEQREDRLKSKMIKAGMNPLALQMQTNEQSVPQVHEKHASDYKDYAFELLDAQYNANRTVLTPRQLTTLINQKKRTNLVHDKCKGTWTNFTKEWKQSRGL